MIGPPLIISATAELRKWTIYVLTWSLSTTCYIVNWTSWLSFDPACERSLRKHFFNGGFFWDFFRYDIQHCFICRPSESTVSENAGIESRTVATTALAVGRSNHSARSHPQSARSHPHSTIDLILPRLDLILTRLDLILARLDLILTWL